jgi:hypothetical protein
LENIGDPRPHCHCDSFYSSDYVVNLVTVRRKAAGIAYATAKRYYDLWADEIKLSLSKLLPSLEPSMNRSARSSASDPNNRVQS